MQRRSHNIQSYNPPLGDSNTGRGRPLPAEDRKTLWDVHLERDWTLAHLAQLIGIHYSTLRLGLKGRGLDARTIYKCERFLEGLRAPKL